MEEEITLLPSTEGNNDLIWEENHKKITECIRTVLKEKGTMPSISFIVSDTQLNYRTVKKHLAEFSTAPAFKEEVGKYRLMVCAVLNKLSCYAIQGDMKAARLFLELMGMIKTNKNFVNGQDNYVEVNSVKITDEVINNLNHTEKVMIENVIYASAHNRGLVAEIEEPASSSGREEGVQNSEELNKS